MKKLLSIVTLIAVIFSCNISAFAEVNEEVLTDNILWEKSYVENLVNELKQIDYSDNEEVEKKLSTLYQSNYPNCHSPKNSSIDIKNVKNLEKKEYMIDEKTQVIFDHIDNFGIMTIVTEVDEHSAKRSFKASTTKSGTKKFSSYGILGNTLFTVKIKYSFEVSDSKVTVEEGKGFITPGFLSAWTGNIWTNKKDGTSSKSAYVNAYGTASWSVPLSQLIGLPINIQSVDYDAYVYCNTDGRVTSDVDYEKTGL